MTTLPRRVRLAMLVAFLCHGIFILTARYRVSYDAYTHMFFADHYAHGWFSLWEPRWFGGFTVVSYPPLMHQLLAAVGSLIGVDGAYALILWLVLTMYPAAIYSFSRVFVGKSASAYAALASALAASLYYVAFSFGQLPTLAATMFALFAVAALADFMRSGNTLSAALAILLGGTTMAAHHATLLFLPFAIGAFALHTALNEPQKIPRQAIRGAFVLALGILAGWIVIWPFWQWGAAQQLQTPIDHLSRHNFFANPLAFGAFILPMYGVLAVLIPFVFFVGRRRRFLGLALGFISLFILGLGGTTPLPRLMFGAAWEWLTYDRFAFWASVMLLPFFGVAFIWARRKLPRTISMDLKLGTSARPAALLDLAVEVRAWAADAIYAAMLITAIFCGSLATMYHTQPPQIDMQPIVDFLRADDRGQWKYQTFGFGDQMEYLSRLTSARTIDGSYFTARTLPILRTSGLGLIDSAFWSDRGLGALDPILRAADSLGIRWGFVLRRDYIGTLRRHGWIFKETLSNGVEVWENPTAVLPQDAPAPQTDTLAAFCWGVLPLLIFVSTLAVGALRLRREVTLRSLRSAHTLLVGLLPMSVGFWYYTTIAESPHPHVYFTYTSALFYLSDAIALLAVISWMIVHFNESPRARANPSLALRAAFAMCCLMSLSPLWAIDWRIALYLALHFWLVLGLIVSVRELPVSWSAAVYGCGALLVIETIAVGIGFATQSTSYLQPLSLKWPGLLTAYSRGASNILLADGSSFLRAYGTLPHPNIVGGILLIGLIAPIAFYLRAERKAWAALIVIGMGCAALALTFSRSAWLAAAAFFAVLAIRSLALGTKKVIAVLLAALLGFALTLIPLRQLALSRTVAPNESTEEFSVQGRLWLAQEAVEFFRERPVLGIGQGSFVIELADRQSDKNYVEPVHNVALLATTELGIIGGVLLLVIASDVGRRAWLAREPRQILAAALLFGIGLICMFDHYFWTLAPGRLMLGLAFGLWEGESARIDE